MDPTEPPVASVESLIDTPVSAEDVLTILQNRGKADPLVAEIISSAVWQIRAIKLASQMASQTPQDVEDAGEPEDLGDDT